MMRRKILAIVCLASGILLNSSSASLSRASHPLPTSIMEGVSDLPAATLLLPYFEVDLANPRGMNTVFSINNAFASALLAKVTIWSDMSVPVLGFNVYLTGFDVEVINLRTILTDSLPRTASDGQDPFDIVSPQGDFSQDINFASCLHFLPPGAIDAATKAHVQAVLTGAASPTDGMCAGLPRASRIARGYVTVDMVVQCSSTLPNDPAYYTDDALVYGNLLWGDFAYFGVIGRRFMRYGGPLVRVRADSTDPQTSTAGEYTFYGRYTTWNAADHRQPLATNFAAHFLKQAPFATNPALIVWRDPKVAQSSFPCNDLPDWYPLGQESIVAFDEQENLTDLSASTAFGAATQRISLDGGAFSVPYNTGWLYLNLNTAVAQAGANPPEDAAAAQAWVYVIQDEKGVMTAGHHAILLDSAAEAGHSSRPEAFQ